MEGRINVGGRCDDVNGRSGYCCYGSRRLELNPEFTTALSWIQCQDRWNSCEHLLIAPTTLRGCFFDGLFAARKLHANEIVCKYEGKVLRTQQALRLGDKSYLMRLGEQCYVDAKDCYHVHARSSHTTTIMRLPSLFTNTTMSVLQVYQ